MHPKRMLNLLCFLLLGGTGNGAFASDPFRYQGLGMDNDVLTLINRFPRSAHEFRRNDERVKTVRKGEAEIREMVAHGSGQYLIRLT